MTSIIFMILWALFGPGQISTAPSANQQVQTSTQDDDTGGETGNPPPKPPTPPGGGNP